MGKCIYCLRENVEFSKEHVITQGLGIYGSQTWTIPKSEEKVCKDCNNLLGVTIDLDLTNDSHEGITRVDVLRNKEIRKPSVKNISISYPDDYSDERVRGVKVDVKHLVNKKSLLTKSQVHLINKETNEYEVFLIEDLEKLKIIDEEKYSLNNVKMFASSQDDLDNIVETLKKLSKGFQERDRFFKKSPTNVLKIEGTITKDVQRAICKLGFNYIVKFYPEIDITQSNFNLTRDFIRNGSGTPPITIADKFLADETENIKLMNEGAILIGAEYQKDSHLLKVRIQIYSTFTYLIDIGEIEITRFKPIGFLLLPDQEPQKLGSYQRDKLELFTIDSVDGKSFFYRSV